MVSLLARVPRWGAGGPLSLPLVWVGVAAVLAVDLAALAGLGLAIGVVQTLDPSGGLSLGGTADLTGRLWLLAQGGELELSSGPLVLAPLLLTLAIAWGLSRAARVVVRLRDVTGRGAAARVVAVLAGMHLVTSLLLAVVLDVTVGGIALPRTAAGVAVLALTAVGWGVARESGLLDAVLERLPGAPARSCAGCWPVCSPRWRCAPPWSRSRSSPTRGDTPRSRAPSAGRGPAPWACWV